MIRARAAVIGPKACESAEASQTRRADLRRTPDSLAPPPHNAADRPRDAEGVPSAGAGSVAASDDRYRKVATTATIHTCAFCGSRAELWQRREYDDVWSSAVMCSNLDDDPCPLRLPPEEFHHATKREALAYWNRRNPVRYAVTWIACRERLPDADERVLIVFDGDVWPATYEDADAVYPAHWLSDDAQRLDRNAVTFWARMPEVPK